uniref:C-type lectin domain-containing protein n=1 Tax=Chelonoidis abingdonii TaxID=106734 RepID=A0A8C0IY84_CHEAB
MSLGIPGLSCLLHSLHVLSDDCIPNPCMNGGTCSEEGDRISCICLPGYGGDTCETGESGGALQTHKPVKRMLRCLCILSFSPHWLSCLCSFLPPDLEKCRPGWNNFQGSCYKHFAIRRSWEDAETQCRRYGGHLVNIMTPEEQNFINNQYKEYQWIGLNDRTIEGDFQWSDGSPLYENWYHGQPDSYFLSGEDCVVIAWHNGGQWSDVPCNYHLSYTCKMGLGKPQLYHFFHRCQLLFFSNGKWASCSLTVLCVCNILLCSVKSKCLNKWGPPWEEK